MGLGPWPDVDLAEARQKAADARRMLREGKDPLDEKAAVRAAQALKAAKTISFKDCAAAYIAAHEAGWKNPKHRQQWKNTLATYAEPVFGHLPVATVDTGLVMKCLEPLWKDKTETASRLRGRIESVLDWARVRGYREGENPARWKGHLENLLPARSRVQKVEHHSALPYSEIGAFMAELRKRDGIAARGLEFAILTAGRTGEVIGATWDEIDLEAAVWTIPADRMKITAFRSPAQPWPS